MSGAAFFDLDGTLLKVNSAELWVRRERRLGRLGKRQMAKAVVYLAAYRLGALRIENVIREALSTIRDTEEEAMRSEVERWYAEEIARTAAPGAFPVLQSHRAAGERLVLLTSSSSYASAVAQEQFGLDDVLCTRYEVRDGRFTGEPVRPICYGEGKVVLAEKLAAERGIDLSQSAFYTDSYTDLPMLLRVGRPAVVNPDPRLRWEARRRRWPVLDWHQAA